MTERMWNTPLRIEEQEEIQKSKSVCWKEPGKNGDNSHG